MIEKNWQYDPYCRDSAEQLQQKVIAARKNCNLNEPIRQKKLNFEEIQDATHNTARYKAQSTWNITKEETPSWLQSACSTNERDCAI
ncbi:hypothetical protein G9A89_009368 [Geosiphon pyriformis]|nr:hypothetical protein G9A89_009368 [Geosiphon pyriformis]